MDLLKQKTLAGSLFLSLLLILPTSCGDEFLRIENEDVIPFEEFLGSKEDLQEMVNGAYRALAENNFMGGIVPIVGELMADNVDPSLVVNQDWLKHYNRSTDIFTSTTRNIMQGGGRVMGRANRALGNLDRFDFTEAERQQIEGEVKFLRAIAHFELVRLFAQPYGYTADNSHQGISIYTQPETSPVDPGTVGEVYEQVIADLTDAVNLLPEDNGDYASSWAARGYLAKVYFQQNDFDNALAQADAVISSGRYELDSLQYRYSRNGSKENIFVLVGTDSINFDFDASGELRNAWRPNNENRIQLTNGYFLEENARQSTRGEKWYDGNNLKKFDGDTRVRAPLVHLTELLLIRAESLAETGGDLAQARDDLTAILERSGQPPIAAASGADEIIRIARRERRFELIGEGNRMHELKRIAVRGENDLQIRGVPWDCPGMVCQFPDNELAGNPNIDPNPEGGCN